MANNSETASEQITRREQQKIMQAAEDRVIAKLEPAAKPLSFEEWMQIVSAAFPDLTLVTEIEASIIATLLIHDVGSCIAVLLVDAASSGKTIALNMMTGLDKIVYPTDQFTAAAFVSNAAKLKEEDLKRVDLLPRIKNTAVICRDMAPIFGGREESLIRMMGVLTRVLDGEGYQTDTGMHGKRACKGDYRFVLLGATTPIERRVWRVMSRLGPRILFLRLRGKEKSEDDLISQLRDESYRKKLERCRTATSDFLRTLWNKHPEGVHWDSNSNPEECLRIIGRFARLLSKLRGHVTDDAGEWESAMQEKRNRTIHVQLLSNEHPDRINQMAYDTARGHAIICGRSKLDISDMAVVARLAFDSIPEQRWMLMQGLIEKNGSLRTSEVESLLQRTNPTALKAMATFCALGVCEIVRGNHANKEDCIQLLPDFRWFASDECRHILQLAKLLPKTEKRRSKQL